MLNFRGVILCARVGWPSKRLQPPKTNSEWKPLKIDGWKMIFFVGMVPFLGDMLIFRGVSGSKK